MDVVNYLVGNENLKIVQNNNYFKMSLDSILLANFVTLSKKNIKILDIGCGNAPIPLFLTTRTKGKITGVEIQKNIFELASETIKINNLEDQINIINDDINELYKNLESDTFDTIVSNPPYFLINENSNLNKNMEKTIARHELNLNLKQIMTISKKLLKNKGNIAIVNRPERLVKIIEEMTKNNIEPKKIQFIYPSKNKESNLLLIEGTKNGNPGLKILEPLFVHEFDGSYTETIKKILNI